jgi:ubiquinone/menaquinone biosynthesis C-methylase UbiE
MPHKFDVKNKHLLESPKREEWFDSIQALKALGVRPGMTVADIGCGTGYLTLPTREIVGGGGRVYAADISREMLEEVEKKIKGITNVSLMLSRENEIPLEDDSADFCLLAFLLHEVDDIGLFLKEVKRILKNPGLVGVIEWEKVESPMGPPIEDRISKVEMRKIAPEMGFSIKRSMALGKYHYGMTWLYD